MIDYFRFATIAVPVRDHGGLQAQEPAMSRRIWTRVAPFLFSAFVLPLTVSAQVFADLKSALVDYSKSDIAPRKSCEEIAKFKSKEIAQIASASIAAAP